MERCCVVYCPRDPSATALFGLLESLYERVKGLWEDVFEKRYGFWRSFVEQAVFRYLDCGIFERGFARVRCRRYAAEDLVAFSCKLLLSWRHTGFSVRRDTHIGPMERKALETIARYMLRHPVILSRLFWRKDGLVVVCKEQPDATCEEIDACEYVTRVLAHVPDPKRHLVHYYGAYSNAARPEHPLGRGRRQAYVDRSRLVRRHVEPSLQRGQSRSDIP
jgi:hypothetical protein